MTIKQTLRAIVLAGAIGLSGCDNKPGCDNKSLDVDGIVLKESGTIVDRQEIIGRSEGALFGNDSVRFGDPTYAIKFKADDGKVYTFAVIESYQRKLEALNLAIEEGTRIRMSRRSFDWYLKGTVGQINDYELSVLGQE